MLAELACSSAGGGPGPEGSAGVPASGSGGSASVAGAGNGASGGAVSGGGVPGVGGGSGGAPAGGGTPSAGNGGAPSGGSPSGGAPSGGSPSGGGASGGAPSGGPCMPATCGTHKWACWRMPNPIGSGLPNTASYENLGNGVVRDLVTCLEWQLTPATATRTWQAALDYCDGLDLGGSTDWRLPTRVEMTSIVDFSKSPAIDRTIFPGAAGGFHKTASDWILTITQTGAGKGNDFAWSFNVSDGIVSNARSKATADSARCVRGNGAGEAPSAAAVKPPNQYTVVAAGEVRDNYTGLVWQQGGSSATMPWSEAKSYCTGLNLNGNTWRLPSVRELATLVDEARVAPAIDPAMFPDTESGRGVYYWASHTAVNNANAGWGLNFDDGFTGFNAGASGAWNYFPAGWVRCVR